MRVKKLEIFGFKSFANKQAILFGEGVTAIVGPNGCGKSNVVDALRWVMGEQNARHLRGGNMQDIIFCGSEKKAPLGFAEVTLTIENDAQDAPLEYNHFNEIEITRRLYKTGESEYEINRQKARLKDISDFFLGTGVGTKAYSIIEQGRVNDIISAKPPDRRLIIEEAAGITKYKAKKIAAERRMEATRTNLARIVDIKNEVDKRVAVLAREKEKLEKVQGLKDQIREIDLHIAAHRYLALSSGLAFSQKKHAMLDQEIAQNKQDSAVAEHSFSKILEEYSKKHSQQRLLEDLETQHKTSLELLRRDLEYTKATLSDNELLITRITAQLDDIDNRASELSADTERLRTEGEKNAIELENSVKEIADKKCAGQSVIERRQKNHIHEQITQKKIVDAATRAARLQAEILALREQEAQKQIDIKNVGLEITAKHDELTSIDSRREVLTQELQHGITRRQSLQTELHDLDKTLAEEDAIKSDLKKQATSLTEEEIKLTSRRKSLAEIDTSLDWSQSGIVDLLASEHRHLVKAVIADIIKVKPGQEDVVEKSLAHLLDAAILTNNQDLNAVASFLKKKKSANAAFFLLSDNDATPSFGKPLGLTCLGDLVEIPHKEMAGFKHQLNRIFVATSLVDAIDHWPAARLAQATIVSSEGEMLLPDGRAVIAGPGNGKGIFKRKNEIADLEMKIVQVQESAGQFQHKIELADGRIKKVEAQKLTLVDELKPLGVGIVRLEEALKQCEHEAKKLQSELMKLQEKAAHLSQSQTSHDDKIANLNDLWSSSLEEHRDCEEELELIKADRLVVEAEYEAFQNHVKEIEIKKAGFREKSESIAKALAEALKNLSHLSSQKQAFLEQVNEKSGDELKLKENERQIGKKIAALTKDMEETAKMLGSIVQECRVIAEQKTAQELLVAKHQAHGRDLSQKFYQVEIEINNTFNEIKNQCERIHERYRLNLAHQLSDFHDRPLDENTARKEMEELKRTHDRMGTVNENAAQEYDDFFARSTFLHSQVTDLNEALNQLESAIKKINKTTKMRFTEAFNNINKQFSQVFPRLFNGGKAELILCDDEDLLTCGVDIMAKPPGKNIGSIELMSGGEKALTAISLIMAIFLIKPSPFCLLDEVDAPLDEANVSRFSQLVKDMSSLSQFIVITHNRKTMEAADQLYGVTMEDAGQSKIVSVHVQQAFDILKKPVAGEARKKPAQLFLDDIV